MTGQIKTELPYQIFLFRRQTCSGWVSNYILQNKNYFISNQLSFKKIFHFGFLAILKDILKYFDSFRFVKKIQFSKKNYPREKKNPISYFKKKKKE